MSKPLRVLAAAASLLFAACSPGPSGREIVLVTLDTTRADAFGQYGRPDARTPTFDRWARGGSLVRWAIADAPLTLPSHATIFTGVPAVGHGVRTNVHARLGDGAETLAEVLRDAGWSTAAVVSSRVLARETGIAQGFARYDDQPASERVMLDRSRYPEQADWVPPRVRRADEAVARALDRRRPAVDESAFFWLHLFDPHSVYDAPAPWPEVEPVPYFAEIAFLDRALRRLQRDLELDAADRVVAITADHGEGLDVHREEEHGIFLYDEIVRVPLVLAGTDVPSGSLLDAQVRTLDVAATLLDLVGEGAEHGVGGSLLPSLRGTGPTPSDLAYSESLRPRVSHGGAALHSLRTRDEKFVWAPAPERYTFADDPGEFRNVASVERTDVSRRQLESFLTEVLRGGWFVAEPWERSGHDRADLRSLGYLGGDGLRAEPPSLEQEMDVRGYDAKDFVDLAMAGRDLEMGWPEAAERKLRRFLDTAPSPEARPELRPLWASAHQNLAVASMRRARFADAARAYDAALALDPDHPASREGAVQARNLAGRPDDAIHLAEGLLAERPDAWRIHLHRAIGLLLAGRSAEGQAALERLERQCPAEDVRAVAAHFRAETAAGRGTAALDLYRAAR